MTADTLYAIEVMPNNVRYYGVETMCSRNDEEVLVAIPQKDLMEIMKFASETGEVVQTLSIYDVEDNLSEEEFNGAMEAIERTIKTILDKQAESDNK